MWYICILYLINSRDLWKCTLDFPRIVFVFHHHKLTVTKRNSPFFSPACRFPLHPPFPIWFPEVIFACHQNCQREGGKISFVQYLSIDQIRPAPSCSCPRRLVIVNWRDGYPIFHATRQSMFFQSWDKMTWATTGGRTLPTSATVVARPQMLPVIPGKRRHRHFGLKDVNTRSMWGMGHAVLDNTRSMHYKRHFYKSQNYQLVENPEKIRDITSWIF